MIAADGRPVDIGLFRCAGAFLDQYFIGERDGLPAGVHMRFYIGTIWISGRGSDAAERHDLPAADTRRVGLALSLSGMRSRSFNRGKNTRKDRSFGYPASNRTVGSEDGIARRRCAWLSGGVGRRKRTSAGGGDDSSVVHNDASGTDSCIAPIAAGGLPSECCERSTETVIVSSLNLAARACTRAALARRSDDHCAERWRASRLPSPGSALRGLDPRHAPPVLAAFIGASWACSYERSRGSITAAEALSRRASVR